MIILTGYYHFGIDMNALRNATATNNPYLNLGARCEADSWSGKVEILGAKFKIQEAVGVFSDKFGFWYITNLKNKDTRLSFSVTKENSSERRTFTLERKGSGEYWGTVVSLHINPPDTVVVNCILAKAVTPFIPTQGVPSALLSSKIQNNMH